MGVGVGVDITGGDITICYQGNRSPISRRVGGIGGEGGGVGVDTTDGEIREITGGDITTSRQSDRSPISRRGVVGVGVG